MNTMEEKSCFEENEINNQWDFFLGVLYFCIPRTMLHVLVLLQISNMVPCHASVKSFLLSRHYHAYPLILCSLMVMLARTSLTVKFKT